MHPFFQLARRSARSKSHGGQSATARLLAILCLLLLSVVSTAQACHAHPDSVPQAKSSQHKTPGDLPSNAPGPDHCPLCVAMHSALPASPGVAPTPVQCVHTLVAGAVSPRRVRGIPFASFSRPPPVPSIAESAAGRRTMI